MSGYCYIADEEIAPLLRPILRRVTLIGSSNNPALDRGISPHWLWLALPMSMIRELVSGTFNCPGFPCQRINCGLTPLQPY